MVRTRVPVLSLRVRQAKSMGVRVPYRGGRGRILTFVKETGADVNENIDGFGKVENMDRQ
jgi:hypothetical protein